MARHWFMTTVMLVAVPGVLLEGQSLDLTDLARLTPGRTRAENALWIENALGARFNSSKRAVVADLAGPGVVTMIHFAMPQTLKLNRDAVLRMYWDGEDTPSVDCPLVDFFCDAAGLREEVNTALVNKRRGFNAYFPMPFQKSARIELVYDEVILELNVPQGGQGMVRLYIIDDDNFKGGRKERITIGRQDLGVFEEFQKGRWIEQRIDANETAEGKLILRVTNTRQGSNAVISIVEWIQ